jgi:hypothetical protein
MRDAGFCKMASALLLATALLSVGLVSYGQAGSSAETGSLYPAKKNGEWGYVGPKGRWQIEPRFNYAKPFFEGRAVVNVVPPTTFDDDESRWGIINSAGEYVVEPRYASTSTGAAPGSPLGHYSQGLLPVDLSQTFASYKHPDRVNIFYFDRSGNKVLAGKFEKVGQFSDDLAPIVRDEKVGYIDKQGKIVIRPQFESGLLYSQGRIPVQEPGDDAFGGPWRYVDEKGATVISGPFDEAFSFHSGRAKVEKDFDIAYIDTEGETVFTAERSGINTSFREGRAIITRGEEIGERSSAIVDSDGNVVFRLSQLDRKVCGAERFHNDLAQVIFAPLSEGQSASCALTSNRPTSEGMVDRVTLKEEDSYGYIDKEGNVVFVGKNEEADEEPRAATEDLKKVRQLYESTKKAIEDENWGRYFGFYTNEARGTLLAEHIRGLSMALGLTGAMAEREEGREKRKKQAEALRRLLKEFGLSLPTGEESSLEKLRTQLTTLPRDEQVEVFLGAIDILDRVERPVSPTFGRLVDTKAEGTEGAVLLELGAEEGETRRQSKPVVKKNGRWMWTKNPN